MVGLLHISKWFDFEPTRKCSGLSVFWSKDQWKPLQITFFINRRMSSVSVSVLHSLARWQFWAFSFLFNIDSAWYRNFAIEGGCMIVNIPTIYLAPVRVPTYFPGSCTGDPIFTWLLYRWPPTYLAPVWVTPYLPWFCTGDPLFTRLLYGWPPIYLAPVLVTPYLPGSCTGDPLFTLLLYWWPPIYLAPVQVTPYLPGSCTGDPFPPRAMLRSFPFCEAFFLTGLSKAGIKGASGWNSFKNNNVLKRKISRIYFVAIRGPDKCTVLQNKKNQQF